MPGQRPAAFGKQSKQKGDVMCYNCGCGLPNDDHGKGHAAVDPNGKAITNKTFAAAGKAFGMDAEESKRNTMDLLEEQDIHEEEYEEEEEEEEGEEEED